MIRWLLSGISSAQRCPMESLCKRKWLPRSHVPIIITINTHNVREFGFQESWQLILFCLNMVCHKSYSNKYPRSNIRKKLNRVRSSDEGMRYWKNSKGSNLWSWSLSELLANRWADLDFHPSLKLWNLEMGWPSPTRAFHLRHHVANKPMDVGKPNIFWTALLLAVDENYFTNWTVWSLMLFASSLSCSIFGPLESN